MDKMFASIKLLSSSFVLLVVATCVSSIPSPDYGWGEEQSGPQLTAAAKLHGYSGSYGLGGALGGLTLNNMGYDLSDSFASASQSVGIRLGLPQLESGSWDWKGRDIDQSYSISEPLPTLSPDHLVPDYSSPPTLPPLVESHPQLASAAPVIPSLLHLIPSSVPSNSKFGSWDNSQFAEPLLTKSTQHYGLPPSTFKPMSVFKSLWDTDISEVLHTEGSRPELKSAAIVAGPALHELTGPLSPDHLGPALHEIAGPALHEVAGPALHAVAGPLSSDHLGTVLHEEPIHEPIQVAAPVHVEHKLPTYVNGHGYKYLSLGLGDRLSSKLVSPQFSTHKYDFKTETGHRVSGYTSDVIHEPKDGHKGYGQSSVSFSMVHGVPSKLESVYKQDLSEPIIPKVEVPVPIAPLELEPGYESEILNKYGQDLSGGYGSLLTGSFGSILTNEYKGLNGLEFLYKKKK